MVKARGKLTKQDRLIASLLKWAPWVGFLVVWLPAPLIFLWLRLTATADVGAFMLWVFVSLVAGAAAGALVALVLLLYRRQWMKNLRDRLARDGITVDELPWFTSEMTKTERRALNEIDGQHLALADAYRETLAARLTASRVAVNAKREAAATERRLQQAINSIQGANRRAVEEELRSNQQRLERVEREARERQADMEARLQLIEATAQRNYSEAELDVALRRLYAGRQAPLALETARLEREAREQAQEGLRLADQFRNDLPGPS